MTAFNTEHVPVAERPAGGGVAGGALGEWNQVLFACGARTLQTYAHKYRPDRNRKMCPRCARASGGPEAIPWNRLLQQPAHTWDREWKTENSREAQVTFACGTSVSKTYAQYLEREQGNRPCPGCDRALNPDPERDRAEDERTARTAADVLSAVKTATSDPRHRDLTYWSTGTWRGFYRPVEGPYPTVPRILEDAGNLMETAVRSCPKHLQSSFGYDGETMFASPGDRTLIRELTGVDPHNALLRINGMLGIPMDDGDAARLQGELENALARLPEAEENALRELRACLGPFGFQVDREDGKFRLRAGRRENEEAGS